MARHAWRALVLLLLLGTACAQQDPDRDGDGLSDFAEVHKYRTDPNQADSDGDGIADGDWRERREYQYTVRSVVQVMRPVTIEYLGDDHQDARVRAETDAYVELEVIHYPLTTVADTITADPDWRHTAAAMPQWTAPGPTNDWTPAMREALITALAADGIDVARLDDRTLVERVANWLCARTRPNDCFLAFATAFDAGGKPSMAADLAAAAHLDPATLPQQWSRDISARGMFEQRLRGSCSSSSIYLNGCLRALGIPTRTVLCIPVVDANDAGERAMIGGLQHLALRAQLQRATDRLIGTWASHSFNEVFVGGRWRRLNYGTLGQGIADPQLYGLITHVATFSDWADAHMAATIGRRQTLRAYDDCFHGPNPYSTVALDDRFGAHCTLPNDPPLPMTPKVADLHWGDGPDVPTDVAAWFRGNGKQGLVARVDGPPDMATLRAFLAATDRGAKLTAEGRPPLDVALHGGALWWKDDHALVFVPIDLTALDPTAAYAFELGNGTAKFAWRDATPLPVPPRPRR